MTAIEQVSQELQKAASMVGTARRLLATGTMVDLTALEGKIRFICESLAAMARDDGRAMLPGMEALIADLDRLAEAVIERRDPAADPGDGDGATGQ